MENNTPQIAGHTSDAAAMLKGKMSPEAQRIAIAEAHGTHIVQPLPNGHWLLIDQFGRKGDFWENGHSCDVHFVPPKNYLSDLNAMHEAEKVLTTAQLAKYGEHIQDVMRWHVVGVVAQSYGEELIALTKLLHATAAQRAEAFLRCLSLWDDTK